MWQYGMGFSGGGWCVTGNTQAPIDVLLQHAWELLVYCLESAAYWITRMELHHWTYVFVVAVLVGYFALRGLGSKTNF